MTLMTLDGASRLREYFSLVVSERAYPEAAMGILCCHKARLVATPYLSVATPGARARPAQRLHRLLQL